MLTPNQIRNHMFNSVKGMYQPAEVDGFMAEIIGSYEQMFKENGELLQKLEMLARKVEEYRQDEDKIKDALIIAQKTAYQITEEAQSKADNVVNSATAKAQALTSGSEQQADSLLSNARREAEETLSKAEATANEVIDGAKVLADNVINQAKSSSEEILSNAKIEVQTNQAILNEMKAAAAAFKADLLENYHRHIEVINTIPDTVAQEMNIQHRPIITEPVVDQSSQSVEAEPEQATDVAPVGEADNTQGDTIEATEPQAEIDGASQSDYHVEEDRGVPVTAPETPIDEYEENVWQEAGEQPIEKPIRYAEIPPVEGELKFGEDYDIREDIDEYDDEDDEDDRGFKGFFRRKK